ncbi:FKBP-type peptidyl-prolyl cis-trans isomerase [Aestuariibaculum suncheonense]|uniref:peptidylprolyl isomerase n=1 Tax=Aestuariibaculum suncheonense TaxID=1028745 RepID=A0A8J6QEN7_9FLAO|nr:hypothetical protein [Aestuariibaculum suncheonense]MBD0834942.1 hypothetical protein [Aestuariibaculum suncheonense]
MKFKSLSVLALCLAIGFVSCKKDDDADVTVTPPRDRAEQQLADMDSLQKYLQSHYYNKAEVEALANVGINDVKIIEITGDQTVPEGYELLETAVGAPIDTTYADTDYQYYVLKINQGGGYNSPTVADDIQVLYEGFTLKDIVFDSKYYPDSNPLDLINLIPGWRCVIPKYNTSESYSDNGDGTVSYNNSGVGVMFLPSGLAYFSSATGGIAAYSPLVFKFELLDMAQNDHDADGIPTYLEGLTENTDEDTYRDTYGYLYQRYDYIDTDDDGDGVLTKNEISIRTVEDADIALVKGTVLDADEVLLNYIGKNSEGKYVGTIVKFYDTNNNDIPDYLESDIKTDYSL